MRRMNVRFAIILSVVGSVLAGAVYAIHGYQVGRQSVILRQRAEQFKNENNPSQALNYLQRYVRLVPDDVDALEELATILDQDMGFYEPAYGILERVLRLDPNRVESRRRLAKVAVKLGRFSDAEYHLDKLDDINPDDGELLELKAQCEIAKGRHEIAINTLKSVIENENSTGQLSTYMLLAEIYRRKLNKHKEAVHYMNVMVEKNPKSFEAYILRGEDRRVHPSDWSEQIALNALVDTSDSTKNADQLNIEGIRRVLELASQDAKQALDMLDQLQQQESSPETVDAHLPRALLLAGRSACELAQLEENDAQKQKLDEAKRYFDRGLSLYPDYYPYYIAHSELDLREDRFDDAIERLNQGLAKSPQSQDLIWNLANIMIQQGEKELDKAESILIPTLRDLKTPDPLIDFLIARILFQKGDWLLASRQFEEIRAELIDYPSLAKQAHLWLGQCYQQLGNSDQQLRAYSRALKIDRLWIPARYGYANALFSLGRFDEALEEYSFINKLPNPPPSIWTPIASLLFRRILLQRTSDESDESKWEPLEQYLDRVEQRFPKTPRVDIYRAEILVAQEKNAEAKQILSDAINNIRSSSKENRAEDDELDLWLALANLSLKEAQEDIALRKQKWDEAESLIQKAEQRLGDSVPLRLAKGRYIAQRYEMELTDLHAREESESTIDELTDKYRREAANKLSQLAQAEDISDEKEKLNLWLTLAAYSFAIKDLELAENLCKRVAEHDENNLRIRLLLFDLAYHDQDVDTMQEVLNEVHKIIGNGPLWHYGEATRLAILGKQGDTLRFSEALDHLADASLIRPGWSRIPLLKAKILELQEKQEAAANSYLLAIKLGERDESYISRAVRLLYQLDRDNEAKNLIEQFEEQFSISNKPETLRIAADVTVHVANDVDDLDRALKFAEDAVRNSTPYLDSVRRNDLIWHGQVLEVRGNKSADDIEEQRKSFQLAEQKLREATTIASDQSTSQDSLNNSPKVDEAWFALIRFLGRTDQLAKAKEAIKEAEENLSPKIAAFTLAKCYENLSELFENERELFAAKARKHYETVCKTAPDNVKVIREFADFYLKTGNPTEAKPLLEQIAERKIHVDDKQDILWSRRNLALTLIASAGHQNSLSALKLINQNLTDDQESVQDRHAKALILATLPGRTSRQQAIAILEQLVREQRQPSAEDRFVLFQLHLRDGNWAKASSHMRSVLASEGEKSHFIAAYVQALLRRNELTEAQLWINQLQNLAPEEISTVGLHAQFLFKKDQYTAAVDALKQFIKRSDKQSPEFPGRIRFAANQIERFSRNLRNSGESSTADELLLQAEELVKQYVRIRPNEPLALAGFHARQGRFDEALKMVEGKLTSAKPNEIATVFSQIMIDGRASMSQIKRAETMLINALAKANEEDSFPLRLVLADVYNWLGRYEKAEQAYRELLRSRGDHSVVLNNLAVLIALHGKNKNESIQMINKAIEISGPMAELLDSRAIVYLSLNQPQKAFQDITEALSDSSTATREFHHACITKRLGRSDLATASLAKAREMGLNAQTIHPVERESFEQLQLALQK